MTELTIGSSYGEWNRAVIANRSQLFGTGRKQASTAKGLKTKEISAPLAAVQQPAAAIEPLVQQANPGEVAVQAGTRRTERPAFYACVTAALTLFGVISVWIANQAYAPEMYGEGMVPVAEAFSKQQNYATFDLNINIRKLRDETVARLTETPDVIILGASQWQEAHVGHIKEKQIYNSHVHRDYWEDLLGVTGIWESHGRLPKQMIITIRDKVFTPLENRKDFLWEPGIPYYRAMADRLGIEKESYWRTLPYHRLRERLSLSMLFENVTRWYNAPQKPHATEERNFEALDTLLPDGSILWSAKHRKIFTPERAEREALAFAKIQSNSPPIVDPKGVAAIDRLLTYLKEQGVEVYLAHPPFNPIYYDHVKDTPYFAGLEKIKQITRDLAASHNLNVIGSFNPGDLGCTADMYIDAEHSSPECIGRIVTQFLAADQAKRALRGSVEAN